MKKKWNIQRIKTFDTKNLAEDRIYGTKLRKNDKKRRRKREIHSISLIVNARNWENVRNESRNNPHSS